jgi:UDP-N-acetylmuramoyl-L-alanyl-D-glutamate--2,6-diaminopimelate ligase
VETAEIVHRVAIALQAIATNIAVDSRLVMPGDVFAVLNPGHVDCLSRINEAIARGAVFLLQDANHAMVADVPTLRVPTLRSMLGYVSEAFYRYPSRDVQVIGVTGTNGKTSVTHHIQQLIGSTCGTMGTLGAFFQQSAKTTTHTTPDGVIMSRWLRDIADQGAVYAAIEMSSHGLVQARTDGLEIFLGVFTNLTHDHLDEHGTMENYKQAKKKLFQRALSGGVFNLACSVGCDWFNMFREDYPCYGFTATSYQENSAVWVLSQHRAGYLMHYVVDSVWGSKHFTLSIHYILNNILAALTVIGALGLWEQVNMHHLKPVMGRLMSIQEAGITVVVDYAHTPDAIITVCQWLRQFCNGHLWCIIGCGGNRDIQKRSKMGHAAVDHADHVIFTSDNPRHEDPTTIITAMMADLTQPVLTIPDRSEAIHHAIQHASRHDWILILGKGCETHQQVGDTILWHNDEQCARQALATMHSS